MQIIFFILILVALIIVHEFGHFIVAKLSKIRVDEFGIFFPPRIASIKKGETEYTLNALPFGGFVKIFGENPSEGAHDPRSFSRKPRIIQAAVVVAGVVGNLLAAWLLLSAGYVHGMPTSTAHAGFGEVQNPQTMVVEILPNSPAYIAGLAPKDVIVRIENGMQQLESGASAEEITEFITSHPEESVVVTVLRDDIEQTFLAKPAEGLVPGKKVIGMRLADVGTLQLPVHLALLQGAVLTYDIAVQTAQGLGGFVSNIFRGAADFSTVAGPIGIVAYGSSYIAEGFVSTILIAASLSVALAIFNLLPIPGLDGGRLLFIVIEGVSGRTISQKLSLRLTIAGFALLITLMLVVSYHDIARLVG
jgi:regulator of sigma E protease